MRCGEINMEEFIVFINKKGDGIIVEGYFEWEDAEFEVRNTTTVAECLLDVDGWGITSRVNLEKTFKPLKFYKVRWWEEDLNTQDGHSYATILDRIEEIDYINK